MMSMFVAMAQSFTVESMQVMQNDLTARTNPRVGNDGNKCALLKIYVADNLAKARGTVVGEIEQTGMEKLIYMGHNAKEVELVFDRHMPILIRFDEYNIPALTGNMVYKIVLTENASSTPAPAPTTTPTSAPAAPSPAPAPTPTPVTTLEPAPQPQTSAEQPLLKAEKDPVFPGGMGSLHQWISANLRYPEVAQANGIQGRVLVQFVVNKDGHVSDAKILRGREELNAEALRLVRSMPRWTPGTMNGHPVSVYFTLPLSFKLPD